MQRVEIRHLTRYRYAQPVKFLAHKLHLRPREGHDIRVESSTLRIRPSYRIHWERDVYGNSVARVSFDRPADCLEIASSVVVEQYEGPLAVLELTREAESLPVIYDEIERIDLVPYQTPVFGQDSEALDAWLSSLEGRSLKPATLDFLDGLNQHLAQSIGYLAREEPGVQSPATTLDKGKGSCRDTATLFIEACRRRGLATRFVSGYLVSSAVVEDLATTHAWAEVYLPGAGWRGFDTTSGQRVAGDHIAVAVHRHPEAIPPVSGSFVGPAEPKPVLEVEVRAELL
jgi:transglutaminase-like putative cysteine protease